MRNRAYCAFTFNDFAPDEGATTPDVRPYVATGRRDGRHGRDDRSSFGHLLVLPWIQPLACFTFIGPAPGEFPPQPYPILAIDVADRYASRRQWNPALRLRAVGHPRHGPTRTIIFIIFPA